MSKVENPEDEDFLKKNGSGSDEEDEDIEDEDLDDESEDEDLDDEDDEDEDDSDEDDSKSKSDKARAKLNAQNRFLKKEGYEFKDGKWVKPTASSRSVEKKSSAPSKSRLDPTDVFILVKNNVLEEDVQDVVEYATFKKISIKEALASNFVKALLSDKAEERATAEATHTGSARRSAGAKNSRDIINEASRGNLPDDPTALAQARLKQRIKEKNTRKN